MAKLADARDLKSRDTRVSYRFDPGFRHHYIAEWSSPVARRAHNPKVMWFKSHLRNQTKEKQPIGLFFLLSGYENDERGSLGQRSRKAMGMAFWQAVSSKARVFGRAACRARKTTRDEDGREAITRRSCGSNPSRLRARSPYGSKVPKGTLFTTVWLRNHIVKPKKISWLRSPKISRFFVFSRFLAGINHFAVYLMGRLISNTAPPSFAACIVPL